MSDDTEHWWIICNMSKNQSMHRVEQYRHTQSCRILIAVVWQLLFVLHHLRVYVCTMYMYMYVCWSSSGMYYIWFMEYALYLYIKYGHLLFLLLATFTVPEIIILLRNIDSVYMICIIGHVYMYRCYRVFTWLPFAVLLLDCAKMSFISTFESVLSSTSIMYVHLYNVYNMSSGKDNSMHGHVPTWECQMCTYPQGLHREVPTGEESDSQPSTWWKVCICPN